MAELSEEQLLLLDNLMYYSGSTVPNMTVEQLANQLKDGVSASELQGSITPKQAKDIGVYILQDDELCKLKVAGSINEAYINKEAKEEDVLRATCFVDENDEATVAIRGTGGSYEAWKDNVEGASTIETPIQRSMREFIQKDCKQYDNITVTGHSKGGCLAQHVTVHCGDKIDRCVSFDGQGFNDEYHEVNSPKIEQNMHKIKCINANTEAVNTLMKPVAGEIVFLETDPDVNAHSSYGLFMHNKGTCDENGVYTNQVEQATGMKILDVVADEFVDGLNEKPDYVQDAITEGVGAVVGLYVSGESGQRTKEDWINCGAKVVKMVAVTAVYSKIGKYNELGKLKWKVEKGYELAKYAATKVEPVIKKAKEKVKDKLEDAKDYVAQKAVDGYNWVKDCVAKEKTYRENNWILPFVGVAGTLGFVSIPRNRYGNLNKLFTKSKKVSGSNGNANVEVNTDRIRNQIAELENCINSMKQVQMGLEAIHIDGAIYGLIQKALEAIKKDIREQEKSLKKMKDVLKEIRKKYVDKERQIVNTGVSIQ